MQFQIVEASADDAEIIAQVISAVWEELEDKSWYVADNADYTQKILSSGKGKAYLALAEENAEIAGILLVTTPGMDPDNLGHEIGMDPDALMQVAHMESAAVLSKYRGNHLQYELMKNAESSLKSKGYHYLMCTIHPDNRYSLQNAQNLGYQIIDTKKKYGGYIRHILKKEI